jgi:hypothetical protein
MSYSYEPSNREKKKNNGKQNKFRDGFDCEKQKGSRKKNKKRYYRVDE